MAKRKPKKKPNASAVEKNMAEDYGYALAFLKSNSEIYAAFRSAIANNWSPEKFAAAVKNTKWYKTHGESARTNAALRKSDPATYAAQLNAQIASVRDKARQTGAALTYGQMKAIAVKSMDMGWNDSQLSDTLGHYVHINNTRGQATSNVAAMRQTAWRNGVKISDHSYQNWAQAMARGDMTMDDFQAHTRKYAASLAPGFADQLKGGMDLYDIAQPYVQSMASHLELNPADVDLFDPTIRKAMSGRDAKGKPATTSLWEFEQRLRQDRRWLKTQNAQDAAMGTAHKILQDFGMAT